MSRQLKCNACPGWHDTDEPWPQECAGHFKRHDQKRSSLPAPAYISDDLGPNGLLNHADGRVYTSKAKYLRGVKDAGCEVIGNEKLKPKPKAPVRLSDELRREIRQRVQAIDSPTRPARPSRDYFGGSQRGTR